MVDAVKSAAARKSPRDPVSHRVWQLFADAALVAAAWYLAFQLRFDRGVPVFYETLFERTILIVLGIKLVVFLLFGFYNHWWRYVSTRDMWRHRPRRHGRMPRRRPDRLPDQPRRARPAAARDRRDGLAPDADSRGGRAAPRPVDHGTPLAARDRRAREGGARRGRGRRRAADRPRDAQVAGARLHADRAGGRRPAQEDLRLHGVRVLGTTDDLSRLLRESKPDEVLIAIPSAAGDVRQQIVNVASDAGMPVNTLPGIYELISGDHDLAAQIRPVQVEDVLGREPVEVDIEAVSTYVAGRNRARHRRRRVDRLRALPPDRAPRRCAPRPHRPRRAGAVRDRARARGRAGLPRRHPDHRRRQERGEDAPGLRALPAQDRLPRGRVQARSPDGGEPDRVGAQQRPRDEGDRAGRGRIRRGAFVLVSTDKALNPRPCMASARRSCEWIVEAYGHRPDVPRASSPSGSAMSSAPRAA